MTEKRQHLGDNLSAREKAAITRDLFERYRKNNTTPEEDDIIASLEEGLIPEKEFELTDELMEELDHQTRDFVFRQTGVKIENKQSPARRAILSPTLIGAIAGIFLLLIGVFVFYQKQLPQEPLTSDFSSAPISRQYVAEKNIEHITLPDGSLVTLNTGTTVSLREGGMEGVTRQIWLDEGEIFLDVKEDKEKPFTVHLRGGLSVQVLGTSFTIQSYSELPFQEITVLEGKVKVATLEGDNLELIPDQKAIYNELEKTFTSKRVNSTQEAAWRTGMAVLENASFKELSFRVRQFFGKEIVFESDPGIISVNITFDRNTSTEEIATEIASLYHLSYRITDGRIIFFAKGS